MVKRIFEKCRSCLGVGHIEETVKCTCNDMEEKQTDFVCEICKNVGLTKVLSTCKICKGKGKVDITGPRKIDIQEGTQIVRLCDADQTRVWCPYQAEEECMSNCACFSIKLSQDNRRYYAVCSHHNPDFILGEVEIEEQMSESK